MTLGCLELLRKKSRSWDLSGAWGSIFTSAMEVTSRTNRDKGLDGYTFYKGIPLNHLKAENKVNQIKIWSTVCARL